MAGARAEEIAELIVSSAEPGGCSPTVEAPHGSVSSLDAPVVLFQSVVLVAAGPVPDMPAQFGADRTRVAVVAIGRDAVRGDAGHGLGGAEERAGGFHVAMLAEQHVHQRAGAVDGAIQKAMGRSAGNGGRSSPSQ